MKRRKHHLSLTVTYSHAITDDEAVRTLKCLLETVDHDAKPARGNVYVDKLVPKSLRRRLKAVAVGSKLPSLGHTRRLLTGYH